MRSGHDLIMIVSSPDKHRSSWLTTGPTRQVTHRKKTITKEIQHTLTALSPRMSNFFIKSLIEIS